jgi:hypothetical protein
MKSNALTESRFSEDEGEMRQAKSDAFKELSP